MKKEAAKSLRHGLIRTMRKHFLAGILVIMPLAVAIYILFWVFVKIDNILQPIIIEPIFGHRIIGVGFGITVVLIYITGVVASNIIGRKIIYFGESLATRIPIFRQLYTAFKQVAEGLSGSMLKEAAFREVILIEFPREGMMTLAFITNELTDESGRKMFTIFVPTAPLPTSGYFEIITEDMITRTNISVNEAMKMIMSSGMVSPTKIDTKGVPKSKS